MEEKKTIFYTKDQLIFIGFHGIFFLLLLFLFYFSPYSVITIPSVWLFINPLQWGNLLRYFYGMYGYIGLCISHLAVTLFYIYTLFKKEQLFLFYSVHTVIIPFFFSAWGFLGKNQFEAYGMAGEILGDLLTHYFSKNAFPFFIILCFLYGIFLIGKNNISLFFSFLFFLLEKIKIVSFFLFLKGFLASWMSFLIPKSKALFYRNHQKNKIEEAIYESIYNNFYEVAVIYDIQLQNTEAEKTLLPWEKIKTSISQEMSIYNDEVNPEEIKFLFDILTHFDIHGTVVTSFVGPLVNTIIFTPSLETKLQKIFMSATDIGRAIGHPDFRVEYPIERFPSSVAFEYAHNKKELIYFLPYAYQPSLFERNNELVIALGLKTDGTLFLIDLKKAPHLLLAGTTGSGKSSTLHTIITNIIWKNYPEKVKLCLIDPKKTEFGIYTDLPHLLLPIAQEIISIEKIIDYVSNIMNERYELFREKKCRNIIEYNELYSPLPFIVIIIDEYADIILAAKHIEIKILKLLQLSRAAGIHVIVATQRPSADVLNTTLKSNLPVRIACKVVSMIDSRIVLEKDGAQKLLGNGDMLILVGNTYTRVHGFFIDQSSLESIVKSW